MSRVGNFLGYAQCDKHYFSSLLLILNLHVGQVLMSTADFFFQNNLFQKKSQEQFRVSNLLYPDQDRCSVCPGLGQNRLQKLSAEEKVTASMKRVLFV